jgi:hypothetical protein
MRLRWSVIAALVVVFVVVLVQDVGNHRGWRTSAGSAAAITAFVLALFLITSWWARRGSLRR